MSTLKSSAEDLTLNADGSGNDVIIQSDGSTKVTVDGDGKVGIGTTSPAKELDIQASSGWGEIALRGASGSSGSIEYYNALTKLADIYVDTNKDIVFRSGTGGATEVMRIDSVGNVELKTGNLVIGTAGKGIDFSATADGTTMTSELLDDYEEGTWTPTITLHSSAPSATYSHQVGTYTKIGNIVTIYGDVIWTSLSGGSGNARIVLPFTAISGKYFKPETRSYSGLVVGADTLPSGYTNGVNLELQKISQSAGTESPTLWQDGRYNFQITIMV